jgi:pyruvate dehydrogenase E2 component (dihydrolipoamide acetyltransferase)
MSDYAPLLVPRFNPNDETVTLVEWRVGPAEPVKPGTVVAIVETSKVAAEVEATEEGYLFPAAKIGEEVKVGDPIAYISGDKSFDPAALPPKDLVGAPGTAAVARQGPGRETTFTRKASKLIREHGLKESLFADLEVVREEDVLQRLPAAKEEAPRPAVRAEPGVPFVPQKLSRAKAMEVKQLVPTYQAVVYSKVEVELPLAATRRVIAEYQAKEAGTLTVGELLCFACSRVLPSHELLNAFFAENTINLYQAVNLGVAINLGEEGLKVPVIHNAQERSLKDISLRIKEMSLKYLRGRLTVEELMGGTFTITDLSSLGVVSFDPVVNAGQSAILGICAPRQQSDHLSLVVAFDHRVLDGMVAAQFGADLSEFIKKLAL